LAAVTVSVAVTAAVQKNRKSQVPDETIRELLNEAGNYYYMSDYRTSYEILLEALALSEKYGNTTYEAQIYANMGNIYGRFNELEMVKRHYIKALGLYRDTTAIIATLNNLGSVELLSGDAESAFTHLKKALEISRRHEGSHLYSIQNNIAQYYIHTGRSDSAAHWFQLSLNEVRRRGRAEKEPEILSNISDMQLTLGHVDSAFYYSGLSNRLAEELILPEVEAQNFDILSRISEARGEERQALDYFRRSVEMRDSLANSEKLGEISRLQSLYDISKADARIARMEISQRYQRILLVIILAALVIVMAILRRVFVQKKELNAAYQALVEKNLQIIDLNQGEKYSKSALSGDRHGELLEKIMAVMEDKTVIFDPKFSIDKLAELTGSNQTYVSQVINETLKMNFRSLLNGFRIREAQRLLAGPDAAKYTIEAISSQVGFGSRTTFREAFKEVTGVAPSFYQKFLEERE
jgi:AraC-like DNA-binding protein